METSQMSLQSQNGDALIFDAHQDIKVRPHTPQTLTEYRPAISMSAMERIKSGARLLIFLLFPEGSQTCVHMQHEQAVEWGIQLVLPHQLPPFDIRLDDTYQLTNQFDAYLLVWHDYLTFPLTHELFMVKLTVWLSLLLMTHFVVLLFFFFPSILRNAILCHWDRPKVLILQSLILAVFPEWSTRMFLPS